jgi:hypothetical protein
MNGEGLDSALKETDDHRQQVEVKRGGHEVTEDGDDGIGAYGDLEGFLHSDPVAESRVEQREGNATNWVINKAMISDSLGKLRLVP